MSKSAEFPNDIIIEGNVIEGGKYGDGSIRNANLVLDVDLNKENLETLESVTTSDFLKYDDVCNNYDCNSYGKYYLGYVIA